MDKGDRDLEIRNLVFGYDKRNILLSQFNATVGRGKITSVIGPNGCGKSTLLSLLTKVNRPYGGSILIDGQAIASLKGKAFARKVASVFQINDGDRDLTVEEFVAYGRTPHKNSFTGLNGQDERIIDEAIAQTGLTSLRNKKLMNMSGGERQRVYIAMALCQQPQILFLDEPTSYLDMYYQIEVLDIVRKINREKGITVVMVLHDINQALGYSDNVIVMKDGGIVASGAVSEVVNGELLRKVYGVDCIKLCDGSGKTYFMPVKTV